MLRQRRPSDGTRSARLNATTCKPDAYELRRNRASFAAQKMPYYGAIRALSQDVLRPFVNRAANYRHRTRATCRRIHSIITATT